jgi:hypothetical protein
LLLPSFFVNASLRARSGTFGDGVAQGERVLRPEPPLRPHGPFDVSSCTQADPGSSSDDITLTAGRFAAGWMAPAHVDRTLVGTYASAAITVAGDDVRVQTPTFSAVAIVTGRPCRARDCPSNRRT